MWRMYVRHGSERLYLLIIVTQCDVKKAEPQQRSMGNVFSTGIV
jgi:hypothetical protein